MEVREDTASMKKEQEVTVENSIPETQRNPWERRTGEQTGESRGGQGESRGDSGGEATEEPNERSGSEKKREDSRGQGTASWGSRKRNGKGETQEKRPARDSAGGPVGRRSLLVAGSRALPAGAERRELFGPSGRGRAPCQPGGAGGASLLGGAAGLTSPPLPAAAPFPGRSSSLLRPVPPHLRPFAQPGPVPGEAEPRGGADTPSPAHSWEQRGREGGTPFLGEEAQATLGGFAQKPELLNSSRSSDGPALGARRGPHAGAQPGRLPELLPRPRGGPPLVRQPAEALVAPAPLGARPHLGLALLGHGVWLLPGLERAGGLHGGGSGPAGPVRGAADLQLGVASHLLWLPADGRGPGGPPADGGAGGGHHRGLAPGEPAGRSAALPVPGLAGLRRRTQLLRLAGQPGPARRPEACGMRPVPQDCGCCPRPVGGRRHTSVATAPARLPGAPPRSALALRAPAGPTPRAASCTFSLLGARAQAPSVTPNKVSHTHGLCLGGKLIPCCVRAVSPEDRLRAPACSGPPQTL